MADNNIPAHVAVLEQIEDTALADVRADIRDLRHEARMHFRWLLAIILGAIAIMIAGFVSLLFAVS
jgi:hypothetical protein